MRLSHALGEIYTLSLSLSVTQKIQQAAVFCKRLPASFLTSLVVGVRPRRCRLRERERQRERKRERDRETDRRDKVVRVPSPPNKSYERDNLALFRPKTGKFSWKISKILDSLDLLWCELVAIDLFDLQTLI